MPTAKTLADHVSERTFRARRHRDLLSGPVLRWPALAEIQARYVATEHELERRAIAVEFERAVRQRRPDDDDPAARLRSELARVLAMPPGPYDPARNRAASEREASALCARDLRADGLILTAIAARLGVSRSVVGRYLAG